MTTTHLPCMGAVVTLMDQTNLLLIAIIFGTSCIVLTAAYRLTLHPLAKYPGPWLAKITELYPLYHSIIGDRHLTFWRLHKKHGDIIRYGPNQLSVNTSTGLKSIYGFKANVQKSSWYSVFPPAKGAWSVWTYINKAIHARKRLVSEMPSRHWDWGWQGW